MIGLILASFFTLAIIGVPVGIVVALTAIFGFYYTDNTIFLSMIAQRMFSAMDSFTFLALPFFLLAGDIMNKVGLTGRLVDFSNLFFGRLKGGLAQVNIVTSIIFGGISGAAVADTAALGSIFIPSMTEQGYGKDFSTAVTVASSIIAPIIPPSIIMVLYGSIIMAKDLFIPITIVAYIYLGVCYAGYPLLVKIIPKRLRMTEMDWRAIPQVSSGSKFAFAIITCTFLCVLFPVAAPLFASFFLGLAIKEAGILRYVEFLSGPLLYGATLFLGFTLGALLGVDVILNPKVLMLLALGVIALLLSGLGGIAGGLIYHKISKEPFNPLVGIAAVSCLPTTVKVAQKCAYAVNKKAMILPFAMGPCVAGVITTAIICGIYITGLGATYYGLQ